MVNQYKKANRYSDRVSVAQAAVEWEGLSSAQQELIVLEDGIPFLAGVPDLTDRAEAIAEAADHRKISGFTHNEDGTTLPVSLMALDRESVRAWTSKVQSRLPPQLPVAEQTGTQQEQLPEQEQLLRLKDVLKMLGIGRSTLYRRIDAKQFEKAHFDNPARWRKSYVLAMIQKTESSEADI